MSDCYMPDQISVRLITAKGSEEEGWDIFWLTPCTCIDPVAENINFPGFRDNYYLWMLYNRLGWLINFPVYIKWDTPNVYGQVIDDRDGKPILELVGENVG